MRTEEYDSHFQERQRQLVQISNNHARNDGNSSIWSKYSTAFANKLATHFDAHGFLGNGKKRDSKSDSDDDDYYAGDLLLSGAVFMSTPIQITNIQAASAITPYYRPMAIRSLKRNGIGKVFGSYVIPKGKGRFLFVTPTQKIPFKGCEVRLERLDKSIIDGKNKLSKKSKDQKFPKFKFDQNSKDNPTIQWVKYNLLKSKFHRAKYSGALSRSGKVFTWEMPLSELRQYFKDLIPFQNVNVNHKIQEIIPHPSQEDLKPTPCSCTGTDEISDDLLEDILSLEAEFPLDHPNKHYQPISHLENMLSSIGLPPFTSVDDFDDIPCQACDAFQDVDDFDQNDLLYLSSFD